MPRGQINVLQLQARRVSTVKEKTQAWLKRSNQFLAIPNTYGSNVKEKDINLAEITRQ